MTDNPYMQKILAEQALREELYSVAPALSGRLREAMGLSLSDLSGVPDGFTWGPGTFIPFTVTKYDQPWDSLRGTFIHDVLTVLPSIAFGSPSPPGWRFIPIKTGDLDVCWLPDEEKEIELLATLRNVRDSGELEESVRL